ncbi:uncharacterized protein LOC131221986 [Magnolia sinica]|uniref:uncharacterized protein LOC131221986 n=1 Tax=Magnolia sinica TaxID=86752 RepID=UPI00265989BC|nr:uncharacterized protein LOC131221986 [Magnolia sinica]
MIQFFDAIQDAGLLDAGFVGNRFTWSKNHVGMTCVWAGLDRVLLNDRWAAAFPAFSMEHLPRANSDHSPLLLSFLPQHQPKIRLFRFLRMWTLHDMFQQVIKKAWEGECSNQPMINVQLKLKKTKQLLKVWNKKVCRNVFQQIKKAEDDLQRIEFRMQGSLSDNLLQENVAARQRLVHLELIEDVYWKQKVRNHWLKETNRNSKHFNAFASEKMRRSIISSITDALANTIADQELMKAATVAFFEELFSAEPPPYHHDFTSVIPSLLSQ